MGDWIRENKYTASVITSLSLFLMFMFSVAKPYVDRKDNATNQTVQTNDSAYKTLLQESIRIQTQTSNDIKQFLDGR